MSEKFRIGRKIGFRNTFYTKCINVINDSIGPSIILRSIYELSNVRKTATFELSYSVSHIRTIQLLGLKNINKHARIQKGWGGQGVRTPPEKSQK